MWFGCRKRHCGVLELTKCTRKFAMVRSSVLKLPLTPESASTCTRCCLPTRCFAIRPTTNAGEGVWTSATPPPDSLASGVYFLTSLARHAEARIPGRDTSSYRRVASAHVI